MKTTLEQIALKELDISTLATRRSDSLDFKENAVWCIKAALEAAYKAGQEQGARDARACNSYNDSSAFDGPMIKMFRDD